jgi:hypothetical protein
MNRVAASQSEDLSRKRERGLIKTAGFFHQNRLPEQQQCRSPFKFSIFINCHSFYHVVYIREFNVTALLIRNL